MADLNAKAPDKRSGDDINPVLANIIKIVALVVIAALIVVITLVVIELINRNKTVENEFEDRIKITLNDFNIITRGDDDYQSISDSKVREIVISLEDTKDIYFYFYYSALKSDIDSNQLKLVAGLDEKAPIFFVDISSFDTTSEDGQTTNQYLSALLSNEDLKEKNITTILNQRESGALKYKSFIIAFNKAAQDDNENPFEITATVTSINQVLEENKSTSLVS